MNRSQFVGLFIERLSKRMRRVRFFQHPELVTTFKSYEYPNNVIPAFAGMTLFGSWVDHNIVVYSSKCKVELGDPHDASEVRSEQGGAGSD
jgi:hypothetical protein